MIKFSALRPFFGRPEFARGTIRHAGLPRMKKMRHNGKLCRSWNRSFCPIMLKKWRSESHATFETHKEDVEKNGKGLKRKIREFLDPVFYGELSLKILKIGKMVGNWKWHFISQSRQRQVTGSIFEEKMFPYYYILIVLQCELIYRSELYDNFNRSINSRKLNRMMTILRYIKTWYPRNQLYCFEIFS